MENYNNQNNFKIKMSIYNKMIIYITLLVIVTVGTSTFVTIRAESNELTHSLIHQGIHFTRDIEFGAQKAFSSLNWVFVENMLSEFIEEEENGVVFANIVKPNGEIYIADEREVYGDMIDKSLLVSEQKVIYDYYFDKYDQKGVLLIRPVDIGNEEWQVMIGLSNNPVVSAINNIIKQNLITAIFTVFLGFAISFVLAKSISKPIITLTKAAEIMSEEDLSHQVVIESNDEIGMLAYTFNNMANKLRESHERLEGEVAKRTADLSETVEKLNESNQQLKDFTYIASHDLREPLRKITSFGELLKDSLGGRLTEDEAENFEFMIDGADRMTKMIEGLLVYSRVSTKAQPNEIIDLNKTVEELKQFELSVLLEEKDVTIDVPNTLPAIEADPIQIRQLMQNLIANGIKYQKPGQKPNITITSRPAADGMVKIEITDNGIGVPPEYQDSIFVMFRRLHSKNEYEGTGIGLAVCKKIVDRHGGVIGVQSESESGSTFYFTMPEAKKASLLV